MFSVEEFHVNKVKYQDSGGHLTMEVVFQHRVVAIAAGQDEARASVALSSVV